MEIWSSLTLKLLVNEGTKVTWTTSDQEAATITKSGTTCKVYVKKAGKVTIMAKANGKTYKCVITVKDSNLAE
jgi:uncharacterized protein YjdB